MTTTHFPPPKFPTAAITTSAIPTVAIPITTAAIPSLLAGRTTTTTTTTGSLDADVDAQKIAEETNQILAEIQSDDEPSDPNGSKGTCQWSLDLLDAWAPMGPKGPVRDKAGKILTANLKGRPASEADDQSALIYL
ncbi:hypothetical protein FH972_006287 [Carpinus fangiana]|uniref:Uncharacterized protein n=1 Tax=Carpinus fangiana TaxID=176857 RepID=A0A5N6QU84_9ROSI|nr:hypothetical protein FH972_006287 [Carpinus fangiana]